MILICDDDATIRSSLSLVLKRAGYEVASAENPHEALGFVRGHCPELILMENHDGGRRTRTAAENKSFLSGRPGHPDYRLGIDRPGRPGHPGRGFRLRNQTLEQPRTAEYDPNGDPGQRRE